MQIAITTPKHERLLYAHRGANFTLPENSLEAFARAVEAGANALELDVHRTKDNVIVAFHDKTGLRVASQPKAIRDYDYSELLTWSLSGTDCKIPTLKEIITKFPEVPINVDIKAHDPHTVMEVVSLVHSLNAENRVRLTSDSYKITKRIRMAGYKGLRGLSALEVALVYFLPLFLLKKMYFQNAAAQVPQKFLIFRLSTQAFIDKCHALFMRIDYWVINDNKTAQKLWEMGADGIMTDDPAAIQMPGD